MSKVKSSSTGLLDAVLDVSRAQAETLKAMRIALQSGDTTGALAHAKVLTGLEPIAARKTTAA